MPFNIKAAGSGGGAAGVLWVPALQRSLYIQIKGAEQVSAAPA